MHLSELETATNATRHGKDQNFSGISIDTRTLKKDNLFVAIVGERFDGHHFLDEAQKRGAAAAVVSHNIKHSHLPLLQVRDTRIALGQIAAFHREQFKLPILAHTGSNGKTTVRAMIASILQQHSNVLATQGNLNNDFGVPLMLMQLCAEHDYAVLELGANHPGEIAYTANLVKPQVAMITNVAAAHTEGFGNLENIAKAKAEIFAALDDDGIAIINADDPFAPQWYQCLNGQSSLSFACKNPADFMAKQIQFDEQGRANFTLHSPSGTQAIHLSLPGAHQVMNALGAAAACYAVGSKLSDIAAGLASTPAIPGRLIVEQTSQGAFLIDDAYNANPASTLAAINYLKELPGTRILVFGDMGELGKDAIAAHRTVGEQAKLANIDHLYTCGKLSSHAAQAFGTGAQHFETQQALVTHLKPQLQKNTACLFKGSRSAQMDKVVAECRS